ncbi:hypothetical protein Taro_039922 [Colocasia esculenta]|uniref:Uncharacterized protein n=1 Tax=Colocasia esculenta TaxID=4460 RepID=A0A843WSX4_COLES|nr:hypothetical protein [Colocasia esculenta]
MECLSHSRIWRGPYCRSLYESHGRYIKMYCKIWQKDFAKLLVATQELIFRYLQLTYQWERTEKTDREMLAHMSGMHRSWRSKQKKRHFNGKPLDDAIASVPAGVDPSDWQTMCKMWTTGDERRVADQNKQNRATQSMPYRRGRTSHYQLLNGFSNMHGRTPHRLEVFKMGRCKDLLDGTESWVDEESRRRYEAMNEMIAPSDVDAESHTTRLPRTPSFRSWEKIDLAVFAVRVVERR